MRSKVLILTLSFLSALTACSDGQYRNLALLRATSQSSSFDFNTTSQLVTDGILSDGHPFWTEVTLDGKEVSKIERGYLTDQNLAGIESKGERAEIYLGFHGYDILSDRVIIPVRGHFPPQSSAVLEGLSGGQWQLLGKASPSGTYDGVGENKLIKHDYEFIIPLNEARSLSAVRLTLDRPGTDGNFTVCELFFYLAGDVVDALPSQKFTSLWKSLGAENEWLQMDLGAVSRIDSLEFEWLNPPVEGSVLTSSDGEAWKEVAAFPTDRLEGCKIKPVKARYVRLNLRKSADGQPFELGELRVFGKGGLKPRAVPAAERKGSVQHLSGGNWKLCRASQVPFGGAEISSASFDDNSWMVATVPGTVLKSYIDNGAVLDPNFADNQLFISDSYFRSDFWYRNTFYVNKDSERQHLHFEGINWKAEVWLNGSFLGLIEGAFNATDFDVTPTLLNGRNDLAVKIIHNGNYGMAKEQTSFTADKNGGILGADNPTMHASIGWDWIPTVRGRNIGIYDDVSISFTGPVRVEDPFVRSELPLPDTTKAVVLAQASLVNSSDKAVNGVLRWTFDDVETTVEASLAPNETRTVIFDYLRLDNPRLWWPNGYGKPELYKVKFSFETNGKVSDSLSFNTGIRQMDFVMEPHKSEGVYAGGFTGRDNDKRLLMYINGRRFIGFGGNWGFPEHNLSYTDRDYDIAVAYHADMNFTMIRNWVGMTGSKAFYEACDAHGIMIWQDFWLANPWDGPDPSNPELFNSIADKYLRRIRNHPSVGLYVGRNEGFPPPEIDNFLDNLVKEKHPGLYYIPHSAADGVSGGGPYNALSPAEYFHMRGQDRFHSEMGMPAVMNYEHLVRAFGEDNVEPVNTLAHPNSMYGLHDYTLGRLAPCAQQTESFNELLANAFGEPADARDFAQKAQWINYDGYRAMFEARGEHRHGLLLWMSNPAWPSMVWQTYDYFFEPTAAYFGCKKACEPIHIYYNPYHGAVEAVNYFGGDRRALKATAVILDMDGTEVDKLCASFDLAEDNTVTCFPVAIPEGISEVYYLKLVLEDSDGQVVSDNFYIQGVQDGVLTALKDLAHSSLDVKLKETDSGSYELTVTNTGSAPALRLRLKAVDKTSGQMLLPVIYEDNYFSLLGGESKKLSIRVPDDMDPRRFGVELSGINYPHKCYGAQ